MEYSELLKRIKSLCNERGITPNTAFIESGVGKNFKSNLKYSNPSLGKITMLANYFDVSVDYLLGKTDIKAKSPLLQKIEQKRKTSCFVLDYHSDTGEPEVIDIAPENMEKVKDYIRFLNNDKK